MEKSIVFIISVLLLSQFASAQTDKDDIAIVQYLFGKDKRLIMNEHIKVSGAQKEAFWKLYDKYEEKRISISEQRCEIIKEYADNYLTLDPQRASILADRLIKNTEKSNKLYKTYFRKFRNRVGDIQATTFYQLETYFHILIQVSLQSHIPVIGKLDRP
jgi:hypothetical protein